MGTSDNTIEVLDAIVSYRGLTLADPKKINLILAGKDKKIERLKTLLAEEQEKVSELKTRLGNYDKFYLAWISGYGVKYYPLHIIGLEEILAADKVHLKSQADYIADLQETIETLEVLIEDLQAELLRLRYDSQPAYIGAGI